MYGCIVPKPHFTVWKTAISWRSVWGPGWLMPPYIPGYVIRERVMAGSYNLLQIHLWLTYNDGTLGWVHSKSRTGRFLLSLRFLLRSSLSLQKQLWPTLNLQPSITGQRCSDLSSPAVMFNAPVKGRTCALFPQLQLMHTYCKAKSPQKEKWLLVPQQWNINIRNSADIQRLREKIRDLKCFMDKSTLNVRKQISFEDPSCPQGRQRCAAEKLSLNYRTLGLQGDHVAILEKLRAELQ